MNASTKNLSDTTPSLIHVDTATARLQFAERRRMGLRAKEAAEALGLPEGAVIAAHTGEHEGALQAMALRGEWLEILKGLEACGTVMALTRNASTVHEKTGVYHNVSATGPIGLVLSREIDLRLFFMQWKAGFAVTEKAANADRPATRSLQFFDAEGHAVHKVYARETTNMSAWFALVARFADASAQPVFRKPAARAAIAADADIDAVGLRDAWAAMQDTHEFCEMLRRFGAERQQSFRLVRGEYSEQLSNQAVTQLLENAAVDAVPIMVFVPNPGCIQIHTGPVLNIQPLDTPSGARWINVLDTGFNLHLRTDMIDAVWLIHKPTVDGIVTSVEVFDIEGNLMTMFFGERKPGQPELRVWRDLVEPLPRATLAEQGALV